MQKILIEGGHTLNGRVRISGAKNSAVALLPAAILADSSVTIEGLPDISDVYTLSQLLEEIGGRTSWNDRTVHIDPTNMVSMPLPNGKVKKLRASYYFMGAMLGKFKQAVIGLPGGCHLGPRPIDQHIKGFEALGAEGTNEQGAIYLRARDLTGARIYLDVVSVGATINIMLVAVKAKGQTIIENAATEPEIIDVATLLTNMGAKINGVGTDVIRIEGVEEHHRCSHTIMPDSIEAGTYDIAASVGATINRMLVAVKAKGQTIIENAAKEPEIIDVATLLTNMGAKINGVGTDVIRIEGVEELHGCSHTIIPDRIEAGTYAIAASAMGEEVLIDNVIPEHLESLLAKLREMGVNIEAKEDQLLIKSGEKLTSANIKTLVYPGFPTDLQQPLTALLTKAEGTSVITDTIYSARVKHIDELRRMNAKIKVEGGSIVIDGPVQLEG